MAEQKIKKLLVLFKTHLDVGFTDYAGEVVARYHDKLIPSALETAERARENSKTDRFLWTTGSWLIWEHLEKSGAEERERLEDAIRRGEICWHGLPFTTHTELMNEPLFEYGLSLSERLDARYGKKTIAAKMTDVPGHTRAMVPLLKKHGIELLHIGVNPASPPPAVPPMFRWRAPDGSEIVVMYDDQYGDFSEIGDTGVGVYFAHSGDNMGAPPSWQVAAMYDELHAKFPDAEIVPANLNDVAMAIRPIRDTLPVVTGEIGDTWIHGMASDPQKVKHFRALLELAKTLDAQDKEKLYHGLLMIPEHTWGMDVKTHFHDRTHFTNEELDAIRPQKYVKHIERSWQEQRDYLTAAIAELSPDAQKKAQAILSAAEPKFTDPAGLREIGTDETVTVGGFEVSFDRNGAVSYLSREGKTWFDGSHRAGILRYDVFGAEDYERKYNQYNTARLDWSLEDFRKIGLERACVSRQGFLPETEAIHTDGTRVFVRLRFAKEASERFGCPRRFEICYDFSLSDRVAIRLLWKDKRATRVTEAIRFGFGTKGTKCLVHKLGQWIDVNDIVPKGNRQMWATDYGIDTETFLCETPDCALASAGLDNLMDFNDLPADLFGEDLYLVLYNNAWASNFPLWNEEDASFRVNLILHS